FPNRARFAPRIGTRGGVMHPAVIQDPANQPWTVATVSLAASVPLVIALPSVGTQAFVPHR
ncbi:MAG: hypothetical protein ACOYOJ_15730, partial [Alsobacter sp.]